MAEVGALPAAELARTFNCGIGMVAIVNADRRDEALRLLDGTARAPSESWPRPPVMIASKSPMSSQHGRLENRAKLKLGVLISGRGSNLQALIDATADPAFPAEIALVISNRADAGGLERAEAAGIATKVIPHKEFASREAFDAALDAALRQAGVGLVCLAGFMRLLTAGFLKGGTTG